MTRSKKSPVAVLVAFAGLPAMVLLAHPAAVRAQFQVGQNGHALDANNRVGSGGYNTPSTNGQVSNGQINNDIVTRNISGLNYFHGKVDTFSANQVQVDTGSSASDRLNAIAAPVDYTRRTTGQATYTPYYNQTRYTTGTPPANLVPANNNNGYVPAPVNDPLKPVGNDTRLGLTDPNVTDGNLPLPGELTVAGPVDPGAAASLYSMSPLYGVRAMNQQGGSNGSTGTQDTFMQSRQYNTATPMVGNPNARLTPAAVQQMRDELNKTVIQEQQSQQNNNVPNPADSNGTTTGGINNSVSNGQIQTAAPISGQVNDQAINNTVQPVQPAAGSAGAGGSSTGEGYQNQLLISPKQQSKQLKALEEKFAKQSQKMGDVDAANRFNAEERAQRAPGSPVLQGKEGMSHPGAGIDTSGVMPATNPADNAQGKASPIKPILTTPDSATDNQPIVITSLAAGMPASGLANIMRTAEDKMRAGKFTEAVDTYENAQSVAPNNPFVWLGRSFAELGASYYGKSDMDLNRAIVSDPAILAGKYDLNGFLGEDRVKFMIKDLNDIAGREKGARSLVLLGFVSHNTGDDAAAAKYLDQAFPRGGYNSLITLMRTTWNLKVDGK